MKTYLKCLTISNYFSFLGEHYKDLPRTGLVMIKAKNLDTGGSSGGGKSAFSCAINEALGVGPYAMTDAQNWDTEERAVLKLGLEAEDGTPVNLVRGPQNSLQVGDGKVVTGAKDITAELEKFIGVPLALLETLTFLPQGARNDFLTKTNGEKQAFLATVLNLAPYEAAVSVAQKNLNLLENKLIGLQAQTVAAEQEYDRLLMGLKEPKEPNITGLENNIQTMIFNLASLQENLKQASEINVPAQVVSAEETTLKGELDSLNGLLEFAQMKASSAALLQVGPSEEEAQLYNYRSAAEGHLKAAKAKDQVRELEVRTRKQKLELEIQNCRIHLASEPEIKKKLEKNAKNLRILLDSTCPTCSQAWLEAQDRIPALEKESDALAAQLELLKEEHLRVTTLQQELVGVSFTSDEAIKQWQDVLADLNTRISVEHKTRQQTKDVQLAQARAEVSELEKKISVIKSQIKSLVDAAKKVVDDAVASANKVKSDFRVLTVEAQARLDKAKAERKQVVDEYKWKLEEYKKLDLEVGAAQVRAKAKLAEVRTSESEIYAEQDFIRLVGREGFLGSIFDEVLAEISAETNLILGRVANTAHVTLQFVSESETKKGSILREIKPVVTVGGHVAKLRPGCSGGMYTAVRLAVRLAIRRVVTMRTGSFPCWDFLDESFEGLDMPSKEACMGILSEAGKEALIFVVDHATEFKEMFTETIELEYQNGQTKFVEAE